MTPTEAARAAKELSTISLFYRMALQARAMRQAEKHNRELADFLIKGAEAAGALATYYADFSLWLSATEGIA